MQGSADQIRELIQCSQGQGGINTAFIERLNATFRQRLNVLARQPETLQAGLYVVGSLYNFCTYHKSLCLPYLLSDHSQLWLHRTPALAAGLTDHRWTIAELFRFKVPPAPWPPPKRRGRPSFKTLRLILQWSS